MTGTTRTREVMRPARRLQRNPPTRRGNGLPSYRWMPHDMLLAAGFRSRRVPADWREHTDPKALHEAAIREAEEINERADAYLATGRGRNHARPNRHPVGERRPTGSRSEPRKPPQPFEIVKPEAIFDPPKARPEPAPWTPMEPRATAPRQAPPAPAPLLEPDDETTLAATSRERNEPADAAARGGQASLDLRDRPEPGPDPIELVGRLQARFAESNATIERLASEVTTMSRARDTAEARAKRLERRLEAIQAAIREALTEDEPERESVAQADMH